MKNLNWLILAVILLVTSVIYASIGSAPSLTWDDGSNIFGNPYFTMNRWWGIWTEGYYGLYVPITGSAWALLYYLGHGQAWPFRAFNVFLHIANILLVFFLLRGLARRWNLRMPVAIALATGAFALHPLQVESVAWISGGRDLLSAFFALSAGAVYFRWPSRAGYLAATLLFALGLLSKPSIAVLPAVIVMIEWIVEGVSRRRTWLKMLPWLGLSIYAIYLTQEAQGPHFVDKIAWWQRPVIILDTYRFYFQKLIWPDPLSGNYAHTPMKVLADPTNLWWALLFLAGLGACGFWIWRKDRRYLLVTLWFAFLLPVSGLVPFAYANIGGVADHYNYLPLAAVAAVLMLLLDLLWRQRTLFVLPLVVLGLWTWMSWGRLTVWENDLNFFMDMAKTSPDSYNTMIGMSVVMCEDVKDYNAGVKWTEKALTLEPNDILALANRAFCLMRAGRSKEVIEMDFYMQKLDTEKLGETQPTAYSSLLASIGSSLIEEREYEDGFQYLCEAYRVKPSEPNHLQNLKAAAEILKQQGFDAICEDQAPEAGDMDPEDFLNQMRPPEEQGD